VCLELGFYKTNKQKKKNWSKQGICFVYWRVKFEVNLRALISFSKGILAQLKALQLRVTVIFPSKTCSWINNCVPVQKLGPNLIPTPIQKHAVLGKITFTFS